MLAWPLKMGQLSETRPFDEHQTNMPRTVLPKVVMMAQVGIDETRAGSWTLQYSTTEG